MEPSARNRWQIRLRLGFPVSCHRDLPISFLARVIGRSRQRPRRASPSCGRGEDDDSAPTAGA
jgi:hypothetical protein